MEVAELKDSPSPITRPYWMGLGMRLKLPLLPLCENIPRMHDLVDQVITIPKPLSWLCSQAPP